MNRYLTIAIETHATIDYRTCGITIETRPVPRINWRNLRHDAAALVRGVGRWCREVAIGSDVALAAVSLAVGGAAA